jgi:hypothetical protein
MERISELGTILAVTSNAEQKYCRVAENLEVYQGGLTPCI